MAWSFVQKGQVAIIPTGPAASRSDWWRVRHNLRGAYRNAIHGCTAAAAAPSNLKINLRTKEIKY
jgi:hypothetical protein